MISLEHRSTGLQATISICTNEVYLSAQIQGIAMTEVGWSRTFRIGTRFLSDSVPGQFALTICLCFLELLVQCCKEALSEVC